MKEIKLTKGEVALIDDCDYDLISRYKWQLLNHGKRKYAYTTYSVKNRTQHIYMHRLIMDTPKGMEVDHINFNGLDNRRANLRNCSKSQNHFNFRKAKSTSIYKGVTLVPSTGKWHARIKINQKTIHLGTYVEEVDAAKVYDKAAIELAGEYAILNFPLVKAVM